MPILDLFRLDGRVAVVTGASKGLGRGIAFGLAEAGADVLVAARSEAGLAETVAGIRERGRRAELVATDLTVDGAMEAVAAAALRAFGRLDIWVNNAGGDPDAVATPLARTTRRQWDAQMELNVAGTWRGAAAAAEAMSDGGAIVNISSRASLSVPVGYGAYGAAKAAVNSLTATLAAELAPRIRVNAVAPGPVATETFLAAAARSVPADSRAAFDEGAKGILGRLGTPEDVAAAVLFLASPASGWITGHILPVTGAVTR